MKMPPPCVAAVKKANSVLGIIRKGTKNKTASLIRPLYSSLARPHLEYCVKFWLLHFRKGYCRVRKRKGKKKDQGNETMREV